MTAATRYQLYLHNAQQEGRVMYIEKNERAGPQHEPSWGCYLTIIAVMDPALKDIASESYTAIGSAGSKQAAREEAAKNALGALGIDITHIKT